VRRIALAGELSAVHSLLRRGICVYKTPVNAHRHQQSVPAHLRDRACYLSINSCVICVALAVEPQPLFTTPTNLAPLPHPFPQSLSCFFRVHAFLLCLSTVHARSHRLPPPSATLRLQKRSLTHYIRFSWFRAWPEPGDHTLVDAY
jgi:hypothetical protein